MYDSYLELYVDPKQKKLGKSRSGSNSNNTPNTIPPTDLPKALPALSDDVDWAQYDKLIRNQKKQHETKKPTDTDPTEAEIVPKKTRKPRGKSKPDADSDSKGPWDWDKYSIDNLIKNPKKPTVIDIDPTEAEIVPKKTRKPRGKSKPEDSDSEDNDGFQRPWRQKPFDIDPTEAEIVPKKTRKPRGKPKSGSNSESDPDEHDFGSDDFRQVRQDRQDKSRDIKGGSARKSKTKK